MAVVVGGAQPRADMHFVDRHRQGVGIGGRAARHPVGVMPCERRRALARRGHDRGGLRRRFGGERKRVGLVGQLGAVRVEQVVFVAAAGRCAQRGRHEQLPDAAGMAQPHRVARLVPAVELADHGHAPRVWRPHREAHAVDAVHALPLRAQALAQLEVAALGNQVQVQLAQQQAEGIRVGAALLGAVRPGHADAVVRRRGAALFAGQARGEDAAGMQPFHLGQRGAVGSGQLHRDRAGQAGAHQQAAAVPVTVGAQHRERVVVARAQQRIEFVSRQHAGARRAAGCGGRGAHGWPPGCASSLRSRRASPLTGRSIHATRLAAS
ncbi:hypothetical protein D9M69_391830 [compost metagenome]